MVKKLGRVDLASGKLDKNRLYFVLRYSMSQPTLGIHHLTAIASDPQITIDFYTRILGLRLVKKTVNQDDVQTYHLFFGDRTGEPGMDLTFFTFQPSFPGRRGSGQVTTISLAVPGGSLPFWEERLSKNHIKYEPMSPVWGAVGIVFYDQDDQRFELVEVADLPMVDTQVWTTAEIDQTRAIRSFDSARLSVDRLELLEPILTQVLGYELVDQKGTARLYKLPQGQRAAYLEVEASAALRGLDQRERGPCITWLFEPVSRLVYLH